MAAFCADFAALRPSSPADVRVVTSDGSTIRAHSSVLAAASPVLERMIVVGARDYWHDADAGLTTTFTVRVLGAPSHAVAAFLRFLYSSSSSSNPNPTATRGDSAEEDEQLHLHGPALLALAHAYGVPWLKRRAEDAVAARLSAESAVDALKLAALCDAPRLRLACARLAGKDDLHAVQRSEGWRFAGRHDAALQMDLLHHLHDEAQRKERWEKERASQHVYRQLSDAMAILDRIFAGDGDGDGEQGPCEDGGGVRRGLEQLMRHFAACGRTRKPDACPRCRRAFQLLRLHASLCDRAVDGGGPCKVALCSNFKAKMQEEGVGKTWKLLVKKVIRARVMSALASREVPEVVKNSWTKNSSRRGRAARIR